MHVDDVGLRIEVIVPDILEQHRAGNDLIGMAHEEFEQPELARQQVELLAPRGTARDSKSISRSATASFVVAGAPLPRRSSASSRASSSERRRA